MQSEEVLHNGSCHCGAVQWTVQAPKTLNCIRCNCSICKKKGNDHFIVTREKFNLIKGSDILATYTFNTHQAKHMFCRVCGVQSFYIPRSNPDDVAIMPHCIDSNTVNSSVFLEFNGVSWEEEMTTNAPIAYR